MEDWLKDLLKHSSNLPLKSICLILLVIFALLGVVALFSDLGFSEEIRARRWSVIGTAVTIAVVIACAWRVYCIINDNNSLKSQVAKMGQDKKKAENALAGLSEENDQLRQGILNLFRWVATERSCQVTKVKLFRNKIYLIVKKKENRPVTLQDQVMVIDQTNGDVMGFFRVCELTDADSFTVENDANVSPMWAGYLHQSVLQETDLPPQTMAIQLQRDGKKL